MKHSITFTLALLFCFCVAFKSTGQPVTLPYTQDWEAGQGSWSLVNDTFTNKWQIGMFTANTGAQSLYISNNGGASNTYSSFEAVVHAYVDVAFDSGALAYRLSFDWKSLGEANQDYLRAGDMMEMEHSIDGVAFKYLETIQPHGRASVYYYYDKAPSQGANYYRLVFTDKSGSRHYSKIVSVTVPAQGNNFSVGVYPNPAIADNITVAVNGKVHNGRMNIKDIKGKVVMDAISISGKITNVYIGNLSQGMYFIEYRDQQNTETIKFIKK